MNNRKLETKSHILKHSGEKEHVDVTQEDFKNIGSHFKNDRLKGKIFEALLKKTGTPLFECPRSTS